MKYQVQLTEQVITTLMVEANSEHEAVAQARCHRLDSIDSMEWLEEMVIIKAVSDPVVVVENPILEMEPC